MVVGSTGAYIRMEEGTLCKLSCILQESTVLSAQLSIVIAMDSKLLHPHVSCGKWNMVTSQVRKTRGRNLPTALQAEPVQVTEGSQLGEALVPYSVAALHVELS